MFMLIDTVVSLTRGIDRINMNSRIRKVPQMVQEVVADLLGDVMPFLHGQVPADGNVQFCMEPVSEPSHPHFGNISHPGRVLHRLSDLSDDLRIHPVKQPGKNGFAGLPHDSQDGDRDEKTNERVRQRIAEPHPDSTKKHGQTRESVNSRVMTICDQGGAADLITNLDAELGHGFVADASDHRCDNHRP